jgi:hypothetical protein
MLGWTLHDLWRTATSGMARLGVPPQVADKILNHQQGSSAGVATWPLCRTVCYLVQ